MSDDEKRVGVTVRSIMCPESLEFATVQFGVPSLETPEKSVAVEIDVLSPDENIYRVVDKALDILIDRIEFQLAEAKKAKAARAKGRAD